VYLEIDTERVVGFLEASTEAQQPESRSTGGEGEGEREREILMSWRKALTLAPTHKRDGRKKLNRGPSIQDSSIQKHSFCDNSSGV